MPRTPFALAEGSAVAAAGRRRRKAPARAAIPAIPAPRSAWREAVDVDAGLEALFTQHEEQDARILALLDRYRPGRG